MSNFTGAEIKEGTIVTVNPLTYSAEVQEDVTVSTAPIECCFLQRHANSSNTGSMLSLFPVGTKVLFLVSSATTGLIIGAIPTSAQSQILDPTTYEDDPLSLRTTGEDFRGRLPADVVPGQLSFSNGATRMHLKERSSYLGSGSAALELSEIGGQSRLKTTADSVVHRNSLFNLEVTNPGADKEASLELSAFLNSKVAQGSYSTLADVQGEPDFFINMNSSTPIDINYPLPGGKGSAGFSIDSKGVVTLSGNAVQFKTNGQVIQKWGGDGEEFNKTYTSDVTLASTKNMTLSSSATTKVKGSVLELDGSSAVSIASGNGKLSLVSGGTANLPAIPGRDETLAIASPNGGTRITAGSFLPGVGSLTKPGVRIESDSGGDIHIASNLGLGGAYTTGSIILDSPLPLSTALSGGLPGYGVVINSPNMLIGGLPGIPDTSAGLPSPWPVPAPPVIDGYVKHFHFMATYNAFMTATVTAAFAAVAVPATAPGAAPTYAGAMSGILAAMAVPPIGRSLGIHTY